MTSSFTTVLKTEDLDPPSFTPTTSSADQNSPTTVEGDIKADSPSRKRVHEGEQETTATTTPDLSDSNPAPAKFPALQVDTELEDVLTPATPPVASSTPPPSACEKVSSLSTSQASDIVMSSPKKTPTRIRTISEGPASGSEATLSPEKSWRVEDESGAGCSSSGVGDSERELRDEARKTEERRLMALISHFQEEQLSRFEDFRRASFPKSGIRRLMQSVASCPISQNVVIAMSGIAKVFVGEIIEEALNFKETIKDESALQPKHIREAVRRLKNKGLVPHGQPSRNPLL